jgi:hypothetical protein
MSYRINRKSLRRDNTKTINYSHNIYNSMLEDKGMISSKYLKLSFILGLDGLYFTVQNICRQKILLVVKVV